MAVAHIALGLAISLRLTLREATGVERERERYCAEFSVVCVWTIQPTDLVHTQGSYARSASISICQSSARSVRLLLLVLLQFQHRVNATSVLFCACGVLFFSSVIYIFIFLRSCVV